MQKVYHPIWETSQQSVVNNTTQWAKGAFPEVCRSRMLAGLPDRAGQKPSHGALGDGCHRAQVPRLSPSPSDLLGIYRVVNGG